MTSLTDWRNLQTPELEADVLDTLTGYSYAN